MRLSVDFRAPTLPCTAMSLWKMNDARRRAVLPGVRRYLVQDQGDGAIARYQVCRSVSMTRRRSP